MLTAHELFYSTGFRATGVDTLIKQAKVTKVTFYRHFPSKSLLILAYLQYRHELWITRFETTLRQYLEEGRAASDALAATLNGWFISPLFHGCAFINASAEAKSEDNESEIKPFAATINLKPGKIASLSGIADEAINTQILMLIDGAIIHAQMGMDTKEVVSQLRRGLEALIPR